MAAAKEPCRLVRTRLASNKTALVVGSGSKAREEVVRALTGPHPPSTLLYLARILEPDAVLEPISGEEVTFIPGSLKAGDLRGVDFVLCCLDDRVEAGKIIKLSKTKQIPVDCLAHPDLSDFHIADQRHDLSVEAADGVAGEVPTSPARKGDELRLAVGREIPNCEDAMLARFSALREKLLETETDPEAVDRKLETLAKQWGKSLCEEILKADDKQILGLSDGGGQKFQGSKAVHLNKFDLPNKSSKNAHEVMKSQRPERSIVSMAHSLPLVGGVLDLVASASGSAYNMTTSTVVGTVHTASSIKDQTLDITSTYVRAVKDRGSAYVHHAKERMEDVIESGLRILPDPLSHLTRKSLHLFPLPIYIALQPRGFITLIGAGPGPADLLTLRALEHLRKADLVIADPDVHSQVLALVPHKKLHIPPFSYHPKTKAKFQEEALDTCLKALARGKEVVRLYVGDPFVFARGAEEVKAFRDNGYEPTIVPGLTAATAVTANAFIPLTHRGLADQIVVLSGGAENTKLSHVPHYYDKRTTVVLNAVGNLTTVVELLLAAGYPKDVPAAVVEKGCWGNAGGGERRLDATLETIHKEVERRRVSGPAVLVIGHTVGYSKMVKPELLKDRPVETGDVGQLLGNLELD